MSKPVSLTPNSALNISASSSLNDDNSSSNLALTTITSASSPLAYSLTLLTSSKLFSSSVICSSEMFAQYITGLLVIKKNPLTISATSLLAFFKNVLTGCWFSKSSFKSFNTSISALALASPDFAIFCVRSILFTTLSRSDKISSKLMVSMSLTGLMLPSTCVMLSFSKHLTTCTIASTSLIWLKNLLPRPSPFDAPLTSPAISTKSIIAGITFLELFSFLKSSSLWSGTATTPTFGSIVQKG